MQELKELKKKGLPKYILKIVKQDTGKIQNIFF